MCFFLLFLCYQYQVGCHGRGHILESSMRFLPWLNPTQIWIRAGRLRISDLRNRPVMSHHQTSLSPCDVHGTTNQDLIICGPSVRWFVQRILNADSISAYQRFRIALSRKQPPLILKTLLGPETIMEPLDRKIIVIANEEENTHLSPLVLLSYTRSCSFVKTYNRICGK